MNPHEDLARLRKATRLVDVLDAMGYTDLTMRSVSSPQWIVVLQLATSSTSPSPETWEVVIGLLKQRRLYREALLGKEATK